MERNYDKSQEWWKSLSNQEKSDAYFKYSGKVFDIDFLERLHLLFIDEMYNELIINNVPQNSITDKVRKKYSSVIADIYAEHHVSPFSDIEKHNEGIIKAMVDFAIFYKENS